MTQPTLYIIAGCNGAGKTTASMTVLPEVLDCREFVNADEIAKGLSPFKPEEVGVEAGKLMLQRIDYLLGKGVTFAIETTLATRSYKNLVARAKEDGYQVILLFFWLSSPEMAEMRVAQRVASGGHNIPRDVIHRRYWAGLHNLFEIFAPIVDLWSLYDNNDNPIPIVKNSIVIEVEILNYIKSIMSEQEKLNLSDKITEGIKKARQEMLARKAKLGENVVIADENGQPMVVPASQLVGMHPGASDK